MPWLLPVTPILLKEETNPYMDQIKQWNFTIDSTGKRNFVPAHDSSVTAKAELDEYMDRLWKAPHRWRQQTKRVGWFLLPLAGDGYLLRLREIPV